tara:strand:- start:95 stop:640 length:546 start_codon:yes stop_codon:yes gene_type:complete
MSKIPTPEELDRIISELDIKTGVGDPSGKYYGQELTAEAEKRIDSKGEPIVEGLPWSEAGTGIYLSISVSDGKPTVLGGIRGGDQMAVSKRLTNRALVLTCVATTGKPYLDRKSAGAALEIPSDLGSDSIKRKYVVEWIKDTSAESLAMFGVDVSKKQGAFNEMGLSVAMAAQSALEGAGL